MPSSLRPWKSSFWLGLFLVLLLFFPLAPAQPGFVSIDCGGHQDFTSGEGIQWKTDDPSNFNLSRGVAAVVQDVGSADASLRTELRTLRYFPASVSRRRSCYVLPLETPSATYLLRAGFRYGNYDGLNRPPSFLVSLNHDYWAYVQLKSANETVYLETITAQAPGVDLMFCLIRVDDSLPALVNSLELRIIPAGRYLDENAAPLVDVYHHLVKRINFGGPFVRYPQDSYDRFWEDYLTVIPDLKNASVIQTSLPIPVANDPFGVSGGAVRSDPPEVVMQTALTDPRQLTFSLNPVFQPLLGSNVYHTPSSISIWANLYFCYFNKSAEQTTVFDFGCTDLFQVANLNFLPQPLTSSQHYMSVAVNSSLNRTTCTIVKNQPFMIDPVINAAEFFTSQDKVTVATSLPDVQAFYRILQSFKLQTLEFGDPCLPTPWEELGCTTEAAISLSRITELNLSGRNLTGLIPADIASLTSLTYLNLSNNRLNGDFPSWFGDLPLLQILDVSNNQLTGRYPKDLATKLATNFSFSGNKRLCSSDCKESVTSTIIAGVVVGGFCVLAIILGPYLYVTLLSNSSTNGLFDKDYRNLQARLRDQGTKAQPFSLVKVREATNQFRDKIGQGGFGPVYRGVLKDGQEVAVKVLSGTSKQGRKEFYNEIELLSVVHHKYLVALIGYCQSWNTQILVYEYMVGGDLAKRLRGESAAEDPLGWNERAAIIIEVAEGLEYLHNGCSPGIIHRDVKSHNILLDAKTRAKVADFGLSKLLEFERGSITHITTTVKGTIGYLDPEYYISGKLNEKSDVYSYGVLMMEVLTGRAPVDSRAPPEQVFILDWVLQARKNRTVDQLVDKNMKNYYDPSIFSELVNLSLWCVEQNSNRRPSMTQVLHQLRVLGLETSSSSTKGRRTDANCLPTDDEDDC